MPNLFDSIFSDYTLDERTDKRAIVATGDMPLSILVSTHECRIATVDTATDNTTILWEYIGDEFPSYYCMPHRIADDIHSELPPDSEIGISFVEDLEWIDNRYVLISICCEPAAGRFELLDMPSVSEINKPLWLALDGASSDIGSDGSLLFETPGSPDSGFHTIGVTEFDVGLDKSDPDFPFYSLTGDTDLYSLSFSEDDTSSGIDGFVRNVSWLDDARIAFDLWSFDQLASEVFSWIGIIDLTQQKVSLNSHFPGWSMPTGDGLGNLVVAEQRCNYFVSTCDQAKSRVVTVDSQTLLPIHELEVDGEIADMDLLRGWLLITLTDGRMGTIDFTTGEFSVIADGISHAVWME